MSIENSNTRYGLSQIKMEADKLLNRNDYLSLKQFPLPIEDIAQNLGYTIRLFKPDEETVTISGTISKQKKIILVNMFEPYERQRFTVAHEIGHAVLHFPLFNDGAEYVDYRTPRNTDPKEKEADELAGCLLMPEELFKQAWRITKANFEKLAEIFYVSKPAIGVRAYNLGLG